MGRPGLHPYRRRAHDQRRHHRRREVHRGVRTAPRTLVPSATLFRRTVTTDETFDRGSGNAAGPTSCARARRTGESAAERSPGRRSGTCGRGAPLTRDAGTGPRRSARGVGMAGHRGRLLRDRAEYGRTTAHAVGADVASASSGVEGDLGSGPPSPGAPTWSAVSTSTWPGRWWRWWRDSGPRRTGGTMLLVGHRPIDPETGAPTPAAGQVQRPVARQSRRSTRLNGGSSSRRNGRARGRTGVDAVVAGPDLIWNGMHRARP